MSEAARSRWPDARFEPQLNRQGTAGSASENPLAELARLVGQDDAFRNAFGSSRAARPEPQRLNPDYAQFSEQPVESDAHHHDEAAHYDADEPALGLRPTSHDDWSDAGHQGQYAADQHYADEAPHGDYAAFDAAPSLEHTYDPQSYAAPPLTPDLWAERGDPAEHHHGSEAQVHADENAVAARAPRRPLVVLASVLVLTGGGLAATFLARTGAHAVAQGGGTPTIMAATGPNKIKLADAAPASAAEEADSALLGKNGAASGAPAKVVNSQEQPIDLTQLPKAAASPEGQAAAEVRPAGSASPFPEPKKVKTFLVRPDGTMIGAASTAAASATGSIPVLGRPDLSQAETGGQGANSRSAAVTPAAPRPSTPKTSTRTATTPKAPPASIADLASANASDPVSVPSKPRQPASPGAGAASKAKPIEVADAATSDEAAPASTGAFGLQLAAAGSEDEARGIFARLQKKYSGELGSFKPTIRKADSGDKSVYRVRVGNLAQDQAKSLCARLQAGGGTCFVVHN